VGSKGRENTILVHSFSHEIDSPRDPASGLAAGKRQHRPLLILVDIDKYSPLLWKVFVNNENLIAWELQLWKVAENEGDPETQLYSIGLTNASIASIRESMVDNEESAGALEPPRQEITFTYQKIEWVWTDSGATAQDDWESL
jgi:type VI secretion system secreted protein Hcp